MTNTLKKKLVRRIKYPKVLVLNHDLPIGISTTSKFIFNAKQNMKEI